MKLNELDQISDAIETICNLTDTDVDELIDNLIGIAWSEEDASEIKEYLGINKIEDS